MDTRVWAYRRHSAINDWFLAALAAGDIACCDMIALELLHSARNPDEFPSSRKA